LKDQIDIKKGPNSIGKNKTDIQIWNQKINKILDDQKRSNDNTKSDSNEKLQERFKNILMAEVGKINQKKERLQNLDAPQEEKAKTKTDNKII
jgi:hypothetical protein